MKLNNFMKVNFSPATLKAIMPNNRKSLPVSDFKEVIDLVVDNELYAEKSLGITANYMFGYIEGVSDTFLYKKLLRHLELSKAINERLLYLKQQGYDLPDVVLSSNIFKELEKSNPQAWQYAGLFDPIISTKTTFFNPITFKSEDVVNHELGHLLHCRNFDDTDKFFHLAYSSLSEFERKYIHKEIRNVFPGMLFNDILKRYKYLAKNVGEFVAFCFTEATKGKSLPVCFSDIYYKYQGANILSPQL